VRSAFVIAGVLAVSCGSGDPAPPRAKDPAEPLVTVAELVGKKKPRVGKRYAIDLVLLPETVIETHGDGDRRFVLAVPPGSPYLAGLTALAAKADALLPRVRALVTKRRVTDQEFADTTAEIDALVAEINDARDTIGEVVVVDIGTETALDVEMETVYQTLIGDPRPMAASMALFTAPSSYREVNQMLARLEAEDPPDLASKMPELGGLANQLPIAATEAEVRPYNKIVARYNRELKRRRPYLTRRAALDLERSAVDLRAMAARSPDHLRVEVIAPVDVAERTLDGHHAAGTERVYLRERPKPGTWAKQYFARGSLLVLTDPPGAEVWLDGTKRGETPYLAPDLPVGQPVQLKLVHPDSRTVERAVTPTAVPTRLTPVLELLVRTPAK
jgi:hypothetical protein